MSHTYLKVAGAVAFACAATAVRKQGYPSKAIRLIPPAWQ